MTYRIADYGRMMRDDARMYAYLDALRRVVRDDRTVLDLGTGAGILALFAAKLGARHVYAVDVNPAVGLASALARDNGLERRITFFQTSSRDLELPEKVDVIVADLRGRLPLYGGNFELIKDAKERFLAKGGTLVPLRDHLFVAPVTTPDLYAKLVGSWERRGRELGLDLSRARHAVTGEIQGEHDGAVIGEDAVLGPSIAIGTLNYGENAPAKVRGSGDSVLTKGGEMHGFALYFDAEIDAESGFSNAPGTELVYGRAFLPLSRPITLAAGTRVHASVFAHPTADDYLWSWRVRIRDDAGNVIVDEEQSKLFADLNASRPR